MHRDVDLPLVSIITPTYNHAAWIGSCLDSVRRQTYPNWEQIIVDDGSTDDTAGAIRPYLKDPRLTLIRQENRGIWRLAENYNVALNAARGELVAIVEGDDWWPPDKLAVQVPSFANPEIGLSYGRLTIAGHDGRVLRDETARRDAWEPPRASFASFRPEPFLRDLLMLRGNVGAVTMMFRRSALDEIGGFQQSPYFPAVDYTTLLKVATNHRAAFLDHPLGVWRRHAGQTTDVHGVRYALGHTRAAIDHFRAAPPATRDALGISEADIWATRRGYLADAYWAATRSSFRARDWGRARHHAIGMLWWGGAWRRVEAIASLAASVAHLDINPLIEAGARLHPAHREALSVSRG